jgi:predicted translin family RNA/ssDNA-binding protein
MAEQSVSASFSEYQEFYNAEQETREKIRETTRDIEKYLKSVVGVLQGIHQDVSPQHLKVTTEKSRAVLTENVKPLFGDLNGKVPAGEYFRYHDNWKFLTTKLSFACALINYLETDQVADRETIAAMLGLTIDPKGANIYLDMEDYLQGLLQMTSELARFSVNCVAKGDVRRPRKIFKIMSELQQAFSELNLKNDHLRRMFDGLKYDVKKVEQVIYDITIRGLDSAEQVKPVEESAGTGGE